MSREKKIQQHDEATLFAIATIILVSGITVAIILLFTCCWVRSNYYENYSFNPYGFALTIVTLLGSIVTWSVIRVFCNMSINIREIKEIQTRYSEHGDMSEAEGVIVDKSYDHLSIDNLHNGKSYIIKGCGECIYTGVWENKYAFYPKGKIDKVGKQAASFLIHDVEPYFLIPKDSLSELLID